MRISVTIFVILISTCIVNASVLDPVIENVVHLKASKPPSAVPGIWKKKTIWKPRWVKDWKSAKVMKTVWKKVWSPVHIREWVPIPKPPPGWDSLPAPHHPAPLHPTHPHPPPPQDSAAHHSHPIPLWDPVPYPESQQPPPPPPHADLSPSPTFNHLQISEIIGPRYNPPLPLPNPEYSETVAHPTRLPPDGNWSPLPDFRGESRFGGPSPLPEFLVPPTVREFQQSQVRHRLNVPQGGHSFEGQEGQRQRAPQPPQTKGHFITKAPDHPYKFQLPELPAKNRTAQEMASSGGGEWKGKGNASNSVRPQGGGELIQEAQLVGEYHYSEFDVPNVQQERKGPGGEGKGRGKGEAQEGVKAVGQSGQKPRESLGESRPRQNPTESRQEIRQQSNQHVQKKHISNPPANTNNFQQQKAVLKEILPVFEIPVGRNDSSAQQHNLAIPLNSDNQKKHQMGLPQPRFNTTDVSNQQKQNHPGHQVPPNNPLPANKTAQQQAQNYPIYQIPLIDTVIPPNHRLSPPLIPNFIPLPTNKTYPHPDQPPPPPFPPNHRLSSPPDPHPPKKPIRLNHYTTRLLPVAPPTNPPHPHPNTTLHLVFPTAPLPPPSPTPTTTTTTTEPYSAIFPTSLLPSTQPPTTPLTLVTPLPQTHSLP